MKQQQLFGRAKHSFLYSGDDESPDEQTMSSLGKKMWQEDKLIKTSGLLSLPHKILMMIPGNFRPHNITFIKYGRFKFL